MWLPRRLASAIKQLSILLISFSSCVTLFFIIRSHITQQDTRILPANEEETNQSKHWCNSTFDSGNEWLPIVHNESQFKNERLDEMESRDAARDTRLNCTVKRVAVIIPYRNRANHLSILLSRLLPLLGSQQLSYRVFVAEQVGDDTFNKGLVMNAAFKEIFSNPNITIDGKWDCVIFHDVDLIPASQYVDYSCPHSPYHMSEAIDKYNFSQPYPWLIGGVLAFQPQHFIAVNGYSNLYWGWGGEDDDIYYRISKYKKLPIHRANGSENGIYVALPHNHKNHPASNPWVRYDLLRHAVSRAPRDGLAQTTYLLVAAQNLPDYTLLQISPHHIHKWTWFPFVNRVAKYRINLLNEGDSQFHSFDYTIWKPVKLEDVLLKQPVLNGLHRMIRLPRRRRRPPQRKHSIRLPSSISNK